MLALRLHLDPCTTDNGPVRVLDGTHRLGRLAPDAIDRLRAEQRESVCLVAEGAILAFRPLLLHASSPAAQAAPKPRGEAVTTVAPCARATSAEPSVDSLSATIAR